MEVSTPVLILAYMKSTKTHRKVLIHKVSSSLSQKLVETKAGISYGGISAIDVNSSQDKIIVGNESGELFTIDILTNIEGAN